MTSPCEPGCPFCAIGAGEVDQDLVVLRTSDVFAVPTLKQRAANQGQLIVVPTAHVTGLHLASHALRAGLFDAVATLSTTMTAAFGAIGSTVFLNNDAPGQELNHLHVHVVPRFDGDGFTLPDPAIQIAPRPRRAELAARLRETLVSS